jgi:hypothetical protein
MKNLGILLSTMLLAGLTFAQIASSTVEGNYDFVKNQSLIGITFDYSKAKVNGFDGMEAYVDANVAELTMMENEKEGKKWAEGWFESYDVAGDEFIAVLNDEIGGKKSGLKFEKNAKSAVYGVFEFSEFTNGKGFGSVCTISGTLTFYDANKKTLAVEDYKSVVGNPSGMMGMFTLGDGYKLNSCYKKAAVRLGKKLYNQYFDKNKK